MLPQHSDQQRILIGLFSYTSDGRRALDILREHHFSNEEVSAAFRDPAPLPAEPDSNRWFGQLRQIYHGEDRSEGTRSEAPTGFDAMLARLDLAPQDAAILDRDAGGGGAIVTVEAGTRNQEAQAVLEQCGARILGGRDVPEPARLPSTGETAVTSRPFTPPGEAEPGHIQLFGEVLRVGKEKVSSGEVRVRKEAVTHMETVQVPVTREHLVVEHIDESGRPTAEETIRIPLSEERVHIDKETLLQEEYKVGKRELTQTQTVSDSVRRERLLIDDSQAQSGERDK